jgi:uncharacterized membrane protein YphA (DoxX/SURF4 family)
MALGWSKRARLVAAWCLGLYLASIFIRMGWIKFDPEGFWTAAFARWGYPSWFRVLVGLIEVAGGAMLVVPWLASVGGIALALVMEGAWLTRYLDHRYVDVAWITFYGVACLWIADEWWEFRVWKGHR